MDKVKKLSSEESNEIQREGQEFGEKKQGQVAETLVL